MGRRTTTAEDYRGVRHELHVRAVLRPGDRVLVVDDRAERGSQAEAAAELLRRQGAEAAGVALVVDELPDDVGALFQRGVCGVAGCAPAVTRSATAWRASPAVTRPSPTRTASAPADA